MELGKWELHELRGFCRQYDDKRKKAADILLQVRSGTPHGSGGAYTSKNDSIVDRQVQRREKLLRDIQLIDECARAVDGGRWYKVLIQNICEGVAYTYLNPIDLPTCNRQAYFNARKKFFQLLWIMKEDSTQLIA